MKYLFLINPAAGKGDLQNIISAAVEEYFQGKQQEYEIYTSEYPGHLGKIAEKEASVGERVRIFACGGEGTVFEVLNAIVGYDNVELGVVPCGSANDFLKFFGEKKAFFDIVRQIEGEAFETDIIKAGNKYCLNGCSVGMDAMVARDMAMFKRIPGVSGGLAYKLSIVKTMLKPLGVTISISTDDNVYETKKCLFAVVANAPYYGGGYKGAPKADPFDSQLDFTLIDVISKFKILRFVSTYEKGNHASLPFCTMKRCKSMEFRSEVPIPVNLDGEIIETCNMRFSIVKKGIKFVVPKGVYERVLTKV